jgi:hypothetical protein
MNNDLQPETVAQFQSRFERLLELSVAQMEALDNDRFDELADLLNDKDRLLQEIEELRLQDAPNEGILSLISREPASSARELLEKYRAHEKYVIRHMSQRLSLIGERMQSMRRRKSAVKGYGSGATGRSSFDLSR